MPALTRPRIGSPVGGSILTTSAPQSANTAPAEGTKAQAETSRTLTPSSTLSTHGLPSVADARRSGNNSRDFELDDLVLVVAEARQDLVAVLVELGATLRRRRRAAEL